MFMGRSVKKKRGNEEKKWHETQKKSGKKSLTSLTTSHFVVLGDYRNVCS